MKDHSLFGAAELQKQQVVASLWENELNLFKRFFYKLSSKTLSGDKRTRVILDLVLHIEKNLCRS